MAVIDTGALATDGFTVVEGLFDADECEAIRAAADRVGLEIPLGDPGEGPLRYRPLLHLFSDELAAVATDPRWAPIVAAGVGPDARLYWDQMVSKPPGAATVLPWHQDNGYAPVDPPGYLTCWLALDDADETNGCLEVLVGSHRWGTVRHRNAGDGTPFRVGHDPDAPGLPVPVPRGGVLVFSSLLMHRSGPNRSDRHRRAWILQFCVADARNAATGRPLDDRLLVMSGGTWLDEPVRERELDLAEVYATYDRS